MVERKSLGFTVPERSTERAKVLASIAKGLTDEEFIEQKASFVFGNAPAKSGITKDSARHAVSHTRPAISK